MGEKQLKRKYDELVADIESMPMFDGRNKGIDVYVCEKCGKQFYTQYKDKGVTPFTIRCRRDECGATMVHRCTISVSQAKIDGLVVHNWVRPTFEQLQKLSDDAIDHVLNGGLMLEDQLHDSQAEVTNKKSTTSKDERIKYAMSFKGKGMENEELKDTIRLAILDGTTWADKTMIERACDWLTLNIGMLLKVLDVEYNTNETDVKDFIEDFRKAMEG